MLDALKEFFDSQNWQFTQVPEKNILLLGVSAANGNFQCIADVNKEECKFVFVSICGTNAPENKRKEISDLLTRLNYGKFLGNFEMNFDDGEIRYRTSIYYRDVMPTKNFIEPYIMVNISSMDICLPGIMALIFGDLDAIAAFKLIEGKSAE